MFKLDNNFLTSLGLGGLPVDEKNKLLQHIYERLEMNVGMRLAEKMTDQQLDEFEGFIDRNDEAGALRWLETNFPNYKQVVAEELEKLKREVSEAAPQILSAAQAGPSTQAPSQMAPQFGNTGQQPQFQQAPSQPFTPPPAPQEAQTMPFQPPHPAAFEQPAPAAFPSPSLQQDPYQPAPPQTAPLQPQGPQPWPDPTAQPSQNPQPPSGNGQQFPDTPGQQPQPPVNYPPQQQ